MSVCFYFGTFNPIHTGHLILAQSALNFGFERIVFVPAGQPPHRLSDPDLAQAYQRANWVESAIADNPRFSIDRIELNAKGPSYTIETLEKLRASEQYHLGNDPANLIMGSDALEKLGSWHRPQDLIQTVCFLQACRPESSFVKNVSLSGGILSLPLHTTLLQAPLMSISSTAIRREISESQDVELNALRYLLPETVRQSLIQNNIYKL